MTITPGPKPITLQRWEFEQLGLAIRDDYQIPVGDEKEDTGPITGILLALNEALGRCDGQGHAWTRRNLRRAMVLIGGMDEKVAQVIVDQEGA